MNTPPWCRCLQTDLHFAILSGLCYTSVSEKYSNSTEGIPWAYWFELIFPPLCLFKILLLIALKYILIPENHSSFLVFNTKQKFGGGWEGRCCSEIFYFTTSKTETLLRSYSRQLLIYFLREVESHRFYGILCLTA